MTERVSNDQEKYQTRISDLFVFIIGVAVGEYQWKVTSVSLKLDNVSKDDLNGNKRDAKRRSKKKSGQ